MYRKTIEHPVYLPDEVRKHTDFESGKEQGRIYRVSRAKTKAPKKKMLATASVRELCHELANPNAWWRETAQRLLIERHDKSAIPILKSALHGSGPAFQRLHALSTLEALGALEQAEITRALQDKGAALREHAIKLAETHL